MYVVAGATGNTGSVVAETLLAQGKRVRVVVRDASRAASLAARGAEIAIAELTDANALTRALEGAEGAYLLAPPDNAAPDILAKQRVVTDAIAEAIARSRVPHVVFLSSVGAHQDEGTGIIRTLRYSERRLAETGAALTFVRAAYFMQNLGGVLEPASQGAYPTFFRPDVKLAIVSTADIGRVAARALVEGPGNERVSVIELAGPREHDAASIAAALGRVLGRPVAPIAAPEEAVVPTFVGFGMSPDVAEQYRGLVRGVNDGTVAFEGRGSRFVRGTIELEDAIAAMTARPS